MPAETNYLSTFHPKKEAKRQPRDENNPVIVAVVDTGVDYNHPDLENRVTIERISYINGVESGDSYDDHGHGTHVAGIIAAETNNNIGIAGTAGEAPVQIMPVKVLDASGKGKTFDVASGIRWATDNGADIINLSLGTTFSSKTVEQAVQYALEKGVVVVAAAGNDDSPVDRMYPAALPGVITVAAIDHKGEKASFSNYGPQVDLAAPGVNILSTVPKDSYVSYNGTSMAAPFVSGVAALLLASDKNLTRGDVYQRLIEGAEDIGEPGKDDYFGYGLVNAEKALAPDNEDEHSLIAITNPAPGLTIVGTTEIAVQITDPDKVAKIEFSLLDGVQEYPIHAVEEDIGPFVLFSWTPHADIPDLPNGTYTLRVEAFDGNNSNLGTAEVQIHLVTEPPHGLALHIKAPAIDGEPGQGTAAQVTVYEVERYDSEVSYAFQVFQGMTDKDGDVYLNHLPLGREYLVVANGVIPDNSERDSDAYEMFFYARTIDTAHPAGRGHITLDGSQAVSVEPSVTRHGDSGEPYEGTVLVLSDVINRPIAGVGVTWTDRNGSDPVKFWVDPGNYTFVFVGKDEDDLYYLTTPETAVTKNNTRLHFDEGVPTRVELPDAIKPLGTYRLELDEGHQWDHVSPFADECEFCTLEPEDTLYITPGKYWASVVLNLQDDAGNTWEYELMPVDDDGYVMPWWVTDTTGVITIGSDISAHVEMDSWYPDDDYFYFDISVIAADDDTDVVYRIFELDVDDGDKDELFELEILEVQEDDSPAEPVDNPFRYSYVDVSYAYGYFSKTMSTGTYIPRVSVDLGPLTEGQPVVGTGPAFMYENDEYGSVTLTGFEAKAPFGEHWVGEDNNEPVLILYELVDGEYYYYVYSETGVLNEDKDVAVFKDFASQEFSIDRNLFAIVKGYSTDGTKVHPVYYARDVVPDDSGFVRLSNEDDDGTLRKVHVQYRGRDGELIEQGQVGFILERKFDDLSMSFSALFAEVELNGEDQPNAYIDDGVYDTISHFVYTDSANDPLYLYIGAHTDWQIDEENYTLEVKVEEASPLTINKLPNADIEDHDVELYIIPKHTYISFELTPVIPLYVGAGDYNVLFGYHTFVDGSWWWYDLLPAEADENGYFTFTGGEATVWYVGGSFEPHIEIDTPTVQRGDVVSITANIRDEAGNSLVYIAKKDDHVWYDALNMLGFEDRTDNADPAAVKQMPSFVVSLKPDEAEWKLHVEPIQPADETESLVYYENNPSLVIKDPNGDIVMRDTYARYLTRAWWPVPMDAPSGRYTASYFLEVGGSTLYQKDLDFRVAGGRTSNYENPEEADSPAPETSAPETKSLPNSGGEVDFLDNQVVLDVPADAFSGNNTMTVQQVSAQAQVSGNYRPASPVFEIAPQTQPQAPVTLRLRVQATDVNPGKLGVYRQAEDGSWSYVGGRYRNGYVSARLDHFSRYTVLEYEPTFTDMANHWAREDIELLAAHHIIHGMSPGIFEPEANVTRAQVVKMLVETLRRDHPEFRAAASIENPFIDVPVNHWAADVITVAAELGIVQGSNNRFRPDDLVTRQELATMIARMNISGEASLDTLAIFTDRMQIAPWAEHSIALLVREGIVQGMTRETFAPQASATRAQAAVMIRRMIDRQTQHTR